MSSVSLRSPLRVGLVQFRPQKARVDDNLEAVRQRVADRAGDYDLLVFPEASLSGYFLEGGVVEAARSAEQVADALGPADDASPDVALGFYERFERRLYNSVGYFEPDGDHYRVRHVHRKMFLPTYGIFDEARFVEAGRRIEAFDTRLGRIGTLICEEMWHSLPATILAVAGCELLVVVSASPARDFGPEEGGRPGNLARWSRIARATAEEHGLFVVVSQLVGSEGGKLFPGGSLAVAPDGSVLVEGPLLEEGVVSVTLDGARLDRARTESPLLADLERMLPHLRSSLDDAGSSSALAPPSPPASRPSGAIEDGAGDGEAEAVDPIDAGPSSLIDRLGPDSGALRLDSELVERTLVRFIRAEVVERRGFARVVLGVSGGVDSAVALFLAVRALGAENVYGFRLPYSTSSEDSLAHARLALEATGAQERTIEITAPIDAYVREFEPDISPARRGNLMARLRGIILFDQSARLGGLPLGTGNKSERLLGYFTWHADDSPPINPLGDLFKTQVWDLARYLGVPDEIVDKPASADLIRGVHDEDELGIGYHRADPILHGLVKGYQPDELVQAGFAANEVELVRSRLDSTHWKRELPTVAVLSSTAIGEFYLRPVDY